MNGNPAAGTPTTPGGGGMSGGGGRPVYATAATLFTPDPSVGHLLYSMRKVGPKGPPEAAASNNEATAEAEEEAEEDYEFLEQLLQSRELNALVKAHNVILFCNQEQCPCVSNACQITAEVMEDIRPFALMMDECRELYSILSAPHVRVSVWIFARLFWPNAFAPFLILSLFQWSFLELFEFSPALKIVFQSFNIASILNFRAILSLFLLRTLNDFITKKNEKKARKFKIDANMIFFYFILAW